MPYITGEDGRVRWITLAKWRYDGLPEEGKRECWDTFRAALAAGPLEWWPDAEREWGRIVEHYYEVYSRPRVGQDGY